MTNLVNPVHIEQIVGVKRHPQRHYGRAVSDEQTLYILHSQRCRDKGLDLRDCRFSVALDRDGIELEVWDDLQDRPVILGLDLQERLIPLAESWGVSYVHDDRSLPRFCDNPEEHGCGRTQS
jgi:hypothetical protein